MNSNSMPQSQDLCRLTEQSQVLSPLSEQKQELDFFLRNQYRIKQAIWNSVPSDIRPRGFNKEARHAKNAILNAVSEFIKPKPRVFRFSETLFEEHALNFETGVYKDWTLEEYHAYHWEYTNTE